MVSFIPSAPREVFSHSHSPRRQNFRWMKCDDSWRSLPVRGTSRKDLPQQELRTVSNSAKFQKVAALFASPSHVLAVRYIQQGLSRPTENGLGSLQEARGGKGIAGSRESERASACKHANANMARAGRGQAAFHFLEGAAANRSERDVMYCRSSP